MFRQVRPHQPSTSSPATSWELIAWLVAGGFCLLGLCLGALIMFAAWDHNPQGEFHEETGVHWLYWPLRNWGVASLLVSSLLIGAPFMLFWWTLTKANYDVRNAKAGIQRGLNPEELRSWALAQLKLHPENGSSIEAAKHWPATFPSFSGSTFSVSLDHLTGHGNWDDVQGASLFWSFTGQVLKVTVFLNADGSFAGIEETPTWAKGILIEHHHK
jgi:hypothetical protein